ncbi:MAG TPA: hypothetical protein VI455_14240 [Terriglobia bacterium]
MGFTMPQPLEVDSSGSIGAVVSGSLGAVGPVTVAGIPDTFHIDIDKLPKIHLGIDPVTLNPVTLHLDPVDLNLSIKEIPNTRAHLPADFTVGLSVLGMELLCVRLCGEAQMITEPYHPNPCERCGERELQLPGRDLKESRERKAGGLNAKRG